MPGSGSIVPRPGTHGQPVGEIVQDGLEVLPDQGMLDFRDQFRMTGSGRTTTSRVSSRPSTIARPNQNPSILAM